MINCIIVEDNRLARETLSNIIVNNFPEELKIIGVAGSAKEGMNLVHQKSPELIFLDIELPDENGFSLFNHFPNHHFDVIFTTSSPDYAISAIKHMAIDYLIKPINLLDLSAAMVRLGKRKNRLKIGHDSVNKLINKIKMGTAFQEKIALPTADGFQVISFNEILYCQASENYSYIHTISKETILVTKTLKSLEELLPSLSFFRIHRSMLLNINYVKSFSRKDGFIVTLETGQKFEVAIRRQEEFTNHFVKKEQPIKNQEN